MSDQVDDWDGTGGGFGTHRGFSVAELREKFAACEKDPSMRGVSAVLRLTREQLEARGALGSYPMIALGAFVVALVLFLGARFVPEANRSAVMAADGAAAVIALLTASISFSTARARRNALRQEQAIRELAVASLARIMETPGFVAKPLDDTQMLTLQRVLAKVPQAPESVRSLR